MTIVPPINPALEEEEEIKTYALVSGQATPMTLVYAMRTYFPSDLIFN